MEEEEEEEGGVREANPCNNRYKRRVIDIKRRLIDGWKFEFAMRGCCKLAKKLTDDQPRYTIVHNIPKFSASKCTGNFPRVNDVVVVVVVVGVVVDVVVAVVFVVARIWSVGPFIMINAV